MEKLNVLSLFDGVSCARLALNRAEIPINQYFASEIDKNAIRVTQDHFPDTVQLGDVTKINIKELPNIDLICGGSPCQGFSFAGKQLNFDDIRSKLFFNFVDLLNQIREYNPHVKFLLENVKMKQESLDVISHYLGVEPILINSRLASAQMRSRYYWTNIPFDSIVDKGIKLESILENGVTDKEKAYCIDASYARNANPYGFIKKSRGTLVFDNIENLNRFRGYDREQLLSKEVINEKCYRKLTQTELEALQTLPKNYTHGLSYNKAAHAIGNGWTVDVIAHIFKGIK